MQKSRSESTALNANIWEKKFTPCHRHLWQKLFPLAYSEFPGPSRPRGVPARARTPVRWPDRPKTAHMNSILDGILLRSAVTSEKSRGALSRTGCRTELVTFKPARFSPGLSTQRSNRVTIFRAPRTNSRRPSRFASARAFFRPSQVISRSCEVPR